MKYTNAAAPSQMANVLTASPIFTPVDRSFCLNNPTNRISPNNGITTTEEDLVNCAHPNIAPEINR